MVTVLMVMIVCVVLCGEVVTRVLVVIVGSEVLLPSVLFLLPGSIGFQAQR
jgi:hypothetical protein